MFKPHLIAATLIAAAIVMGLALGYSSEPGPKPAIASMLQQSECTVTTALSPPCACGVNCRRVSLPVTNPAHCDGSGFRVVGQGTTCGTAPQVTIRVYCTGQSSPAFNQQVNIHNNQFAFDAGTICAGTTVERVDASFTINGLVNTLSATVTCNNCEPPTPTSTATGSPTVTASATATASPTATSTATATPTPTPTSTDLPSPVPTPSFGSFQMQIHGGIMCSQDQSAACPLPAHQSDAVSGNVWATWNPSSGFNNHGWVIRYAGVFRSQNGSFQAAHDVYINPQTGTLWLYSKNIGGLSVNHPDALRNLTGTPSAYSCGGNDWVSHYYLAGEFTTSYFAPDPNGVMTRWDLELVPNNGGPGTVQTWRVFVDIPGSLQNMNFIRVDNAPDNQFPNSQNMCQMCDALNKPGYNLTCEGCPTTDVLVCCSSNTPFQGLIPRPGTGIGNVINVMFAPKALVQPLQPPECIP